MVRQQGTYRSTSRRFGFPLADVCAGNCSWQCDRSQALELASRTEQNKRIHKARVKRNTELIYTCEQIKKTKTELKQN